LSPREYKTPRRKSRFIGCLVHEITHHFIQAQTKATFLSMERKQNMDLPMWFEEGLCQVIQCEVDTQLLHILTGQLQSIKKWYSFEDLWNDLSACDDVKTAYLQAFMAMKHLFERYGKDYIKKILLMNAQKSVDWLAVNTKMNKVFSSFGGENYSRMLFQEES
jgi:hypothetical protein